MKINALYNDYVMRYNVPILNQSVSPICWVVCAAMVQKYWQQTAGGDFDTTMLTGGASPLNSCIPGSANLNSFYEGIQDAGFHIYDNPPYTMTERHLNVLLSNHGPLVFTHQCLNFNYGATRGGKVTATSQLATGAHAVVITGIEGTRAYFNNPWGDKDVEIPSSDLLASLHQAITVYRPLAYAVASPTPRNVI
jgi:hypothetical protein